MSVFRGICFIAKCTLNRLCFVAVRTLFNFVQYLVWHFQSTNQDVWEAHQAGKYERSAQIVNIVWRNHVDMIMPYTLGDFLFFHHGFVSPKYVLQDHISLFFIDADNVVFAEAEPTVQTWKSKYGAFVRESNGQYAKKLIILPLKSFIRLGEELGRPDKKIVFLFNTARCGSTLLSQMMENTGRCVSISEPEGLFYITKKYRDCGDTKELRQLTTSFINLTCKPVSDPEDTIVYFVKLGPTASVGVPFLRKLYPESRFFFMYRDAVQVAKSVYRMVQVIPFLLLTMYAGCLSENVMERIVNDLGISGKDYKMRYKDFLGMGTSSWGISVKLYLDMRMGDADLRCLRYEDLMSDPIFMMREILRCCDLPEELAEPSTEALKQDSQVKSVLGQSHRFISPSLTPQREKNMNEILEKFNLPRCGESIIFEGIIGWKGISN